jgi:hypothetical protein
LNPATQELLILYSQDSLQRIGAFNVATRVTRELVTAEKNFDIWQCCFSRDHSMIAFVEHGPQNSYVSVLKNSERRRIYRLPGGYSNTFISWERIEFSPEGKYLAFIKSVFENGDPSESYLYIVNIETDETTCIPNTYQVSWRPER